MRVSQLFASKHRYSNLYVSSGIQSIKQSEETNLMPTNKVRKGKEDKYDWSNHDIHNSQKEVQLETWESCREIHTAWVHSLLSIFFDFHHERVLKMKNDQRF